MSLSKRKPTKPIIPIPQPGKGPTGGRPVYTPTAPPKNPHPLSQPTPAATPAPAAPAAPAPTAPGGILGPTVIPETTSGHNQRTDAQGVFNTTIGGLGDQAYSAAMALGDPNVIGQYGAAVTNDAGALPTIQRNLTETLRNLGLQHNQGNTFFSGMHQRDDSMSNEQASRDMGDAVQRFNDAIKTINNLKLGAGDTLRGALHGADQTDLDAWLANPPTAQSAAGGAAALSPRDMVLAAIAAGQKAPVKSTSGVPTGNPTGGRPLVDQTPPAHQGPPIRHQPLLVIPGKRRTK